MNEVDRSLLVDPDIFPILLGPTSPRFPPGSSIGPPSKPVDLPAPPSIPGPLRALAPKAAPGSSSYREDKKQSTRWEKKEKKQMKKN